MDYLMVPVMAQASFGNKARIQVGVGPYAGMLLRSRRSFGDEVNFPTTDTTNELKQWDMGISASMGGSLPLTDALRFEAMVRYDKGLSNISALPVFGGGTIHTNAVCLLLGCSYRLTRTDRPASTLTIGPGRSFLHACLVRSSRGNDHPRAKRRPHPV